MQCCLPRIDDVCSRTPVGLRLPVPFAGHQPCLLPPPSLAAGLCGRRHAGPPVCGLLSRPGGQSWCKLVCRSQPVCCLLSRPGGLAGTGGVLPRSRPVCMHMPGYSKLACGRPRLPYHLQLAAAASRCRPSCHCLSTGSQGVCAAPDGAARGRAVRSHCQVRGPDCLPAAAQLQLWCRGVVRLVQAACVWQTMGALQVGLLPPVHL